MEVAVLPDAASAASAAADRIAAALRAAVAARGTASLALSGGTTPWVMLAELAGLDVPWGSLHVFQVDERVAPDGDPARNLTHLRESLLERAPLPADRLHAMPVEDHDLDAAAGWYETELRALTDGVLDVVHLGLGDDGHTASLAPGDAVTEERARLVAPTASEFRGERRVTLTYPALDAARQVLFLATGEAKAPVVPRLVAGDEAIPAGRVRAATQALVVDEAAAAGLAR